MLDPSCEICRSILDSKNNNKPMEEFFCWMNAIAIYDIDKAREISKKIEPVKVPIEKLARFVFYTGVPNQLRILSVYVNEDHIDHVPDSKDDPIIAALTLKPIHKDDPPRMLIPIDGHHRIARDIKYKREFAYVVSLSEEETDSLITDNRPKRKRKRV